MLLSRLSACLVPLSLTMSGANVACGQTFPDRPIRIVTSGLGGGADVVARILLPALEADLGRPVSVDNQAVGIVPIEMVAKAPADGYTLLAYSSTLWITPLMQKMPYDTVRDFSPVAWLTSAPNILVVHPSLPAKSVAELIALARANPGIIHFASSGSGGAVHLAAELFKAMSAINIVHVPYKGNAPARDDLLAGKVHMMFSNAGSVTPHIKAGKLRALGVTTEQPSTLLPGLPTIAASGLPGYETASILSVFAPTGTPGVTVDRLNQAFVRVLARPDIKEKLATVGVESVASSPQQLAAKVKSEIARLGKVIADAGIRID